MLTDQVLVIRFNINKAEAVDVGKLGRKGLSQVSTLAQIFLNYVGIVDN